ncbi:MAG: thiamine pyrophosphate-dependent enzyme [Balneolaceae bacterium]
MNRLLKKISEKDLTRYYEAILLPRMIEQRMLHLLRQNRIGKWFSGIGQEAISAGTVLALKSDDLLLPMHRNLGIFTTRDVPLYPLFCQLLGRADGYTGGRDRSFHFGIPEKKIYGMISHLAATMPMADGLALAQKLKNRDRVAVSFCGDGATSEGDFHEALNLAAVWKLPVIFLIENNGWALSTPIREQFACNQLADRAAGYGIEGMTVDGNDLFSVMEAVGEARKIAAQGVPVLLEAVTWRMRGHEEASGTDYIPGDELKKWAGKDPVTHIEKMIQDRFPNKGESIINKSKKNLGDRIGVELKKALDAPEPLSDIHREIKDAGLFRSKKWGVSTQKNPGANLIEKRYIDALRDGLLQAFREDPALVMMGQDIAEYGGVFKVTQGFLEAFGRERIRNTPVMESGLIGAAIGLALEDIPSVVEIQFADFISCGFNQIINHLAKGRYRWMPPLNVTIRAPHGAGSGAGPFHSQSPEGWFMGQSGLRIVVPATVEDAQNMAYSALKDPNPVLLFEHKMLYRSLRDRVSEKAEWTDLERASVRREGRDATIVTYGMGLHWALEAAKTYESKGFELEVIDLRSLAPLDMPAVASSVKKTGKVVLLEEAPRTMGPMSEVESRIIESCFEWLDAPPVRCSSMDTPIPASRILEQSWIASSRLYEVLNRLFEW